MKADTLIRLRTIMDESFCLALIGTRSPGLRSAVTDHEPGTLGIAAATVAALAERAARSLSPQTDRAALEQFLLPLEVICYGADAAFAMATGCPASLAAAQESLEARMVAATALAEDVEILTCAPDRYASWPGVRLRIFDAAPRPDRGAQGGADRRSTILAMGSHDFSLDMLGERVQALDPQVRFCTAHVGSLQGVLAIQRDEAHLAGTHLLDEETGEYNTPIVRRVFSQHGTRALLVGFVTRIQGIIVAAGNPRAIHRIEDMTRDDVTIVNRQSGAGTRVLLDMNLRRHRLSPRSLRGYANECYSHSAVAATIASGVADCGLGIQAAAHGYGLGFVPLVEERYDLLIPVKHYESALLSTLRAQLEHPDPDMLRAVHAMGGYSTEGMGRVLAEF